MCLMNIYRQHNDLERNITTSTVTLGRNIVWFVSRPFRLICRNKITCFGCIFVNTIVEMNLTALAGSLWSRYHLSRSGVRFS